MMDMSDRPHVVALCRKLSNDLYHKQNLETIDQWIVARADIDKVDWKMVQQMCRDLIRRTIEAHYRLGGRNLFGLFDKIQMAENLVEYFKSRHNGS